MIPPHLMPLRLPAAGFAATAVTYGPARMGFGLFLPAFRTSFEISTRMVGIISSIGFFGFLLGLVLAQILTAKRGARLPVLTGIFFAAIGMGLVAAAPNLPVLSAGVFLAMSSAGFSWAPFNHMVHKSIERGSRPAVLSVISTGTTLGVIGAGGAAIALALSGLSWRLCWAAFAVLGLLAALGNAHALREQKKGALPPGSGRGWRRLIRRAALPLFAISLSYGATSAVYLSFAPDHIAARGGVPGLPAGAAPGLVFVFYGLFGLFGLAAGRAERVVGLAFLLRSLLLISALSLALLAFVPTAWGGLVLSAGLQGLVVMTTSAVLAFWSERLFPALPAVSFTAALIALALGSVIGPFGAGLAAEAFGKETMFLLAAGFSAATMALIPERAITQTPLAA